MLFKNLFIVSLFSRNEPLVCDLLSVFHCFPLNPGSLFLFLITPPRQWVGCRLCFERNVNDAFCHVNICGSAFLSPKMADKLRKRRAAKKQKAELGVRRNWV